MTSLKFLPVLLLATFALTIHSAHAGNKIWTTPSAPTGYPISPLGNVIKVHVGDTVKFTAHANTDNDTYEDSDTHTLYPNQSDGEAYTFYGYGGSPTGGLSDNRVLSGETVTFTAATTTGVAYVSVYADDKWAGLVSGVDCPDIGNRNDDGTFLKQWTIIIVDDCPTSISGAFHCSPTSPYTNSPWSWGVAIYKMTANLTTTNWNGQIINEKVTFNSSSTTCDPADIDGGIAQFCSGDSSFTIGQGSSSVGNCTQQTAAQNKFYDYHGAGDATKSLLVGDACDVVCDQIYTCGGETIGSFTITFSFSLDSNDNTVIAISK